MQRRASHKPTYKGQLHFRPNTEASWHIHTSHSQHRNTHKTAVLIITARLKTPLKQGTLGIYSITVCAFSWLSNCASRHAALNTSWHDVSCCSAQPYCSVFIMWRGTELTVAAIVNRACSSPVSLQWLQQAFHFQGEAGLKSCKLAHKLPLRFFQVSPKYFPQPQYEHLLCKEGKGPQSCCND